VYHLLATIAQVSNEKNYQLRAEKISHDEIGEQKILDDITNTFANYLTN